MSNGNGASSSELPASVLICDDNAAIRVLLGVIVDESPNMYVVGEAADGTEAIAEAARLQPDVIMLDLAMPNLSGLDAIPELRRVAPDAPIVVFSGFAGTAVASQVLALGATSYLEKGSHPETIVAAIEEALAGRPTAGAALSRGAEIRTRDL